MIKVKTIAAKLPLLIVLSNISFFAAAINPNPLTHPELIKKANGQKNVAKMSLFRAVNPFHRDVDFGYERMLTDHISFSLSMAIKVPYIPASLREFDGQKTNITDDLGTVTATSTMNISPLRGFGINPEFKFYTGKDKDAPEGFYVAPYFRYYSTRMEASADVDFVDPLSNDASTTVQFKFTEAGGGIQLGYQWVIGPGITIDWYFLGPRISKFNFNLLFTGDIGDPGYYQEAEGDMKDAFIDIPIIGGNVTTTTTVNSLEVRAPFWFPNIRSGIAIGAAF